MPPGYCGGGVSTLIVAGQQDHSTPPALSQWLQAHIAGSQLIELPCAHLSPVEVPDDVTTAMLAFLRG